MSIEHGSLTYRAYKPSHRITVNDVTRFAAQAAPSVEAVTDNIVTGWVTGRHLLDRNITPESAYYAGFLRLSLLKAERKVPSAQLRAECRIEELAMQEAMGLAFLSRQQRMEIRKAIYDRLLPTMPVTLKGIDVVYEEHYLVNRLYTTAMSDKQQDALSIHFAQTLGFHIVPVLPATMANVGMWSAACFAGDTYDLIHDPGADFLTWLWFVSETQGGCLQHHELGLYHVMIEGPLHFVGGLGSSDVTIKRGEPRLSAEAKSALLAGKKLCRAKLCFAEGDRVWTCGLTADFGVYGLRMPPVEKMDQHSAFQQRMGLLAQFQGMLEGAFGVFATLRNDVASWERTLAEMREWIGKRRVRRD